LNAGGHANASRLGQTFEMSRDVYAVTEDVAAVLNNDVALVNADTELDATGRWYISVTIGNAALPFGRTTQGIDHTGKFDQQAVTGRLHNAAPVFVDFGSMTSARIDLSRLSVPSSSVPMSREYPAMSAATIAARRRVWVMSRRQRPTASPTGEARSARDFGKGRVSVQRLE
jgi:hypothetical protein